MNRFARRLLSGASLATLQLCGLAAVSVARASAGVTIATTRGAYTVAHGQNPEYILVTNTGHITGDLTNEGTVGVASVGIDIQGSGSVSGSVINAAGGIISATNIGVLIDGTVDGLVNAGKILVSASSTNSASARGVVYNAAGNTKLTSTGDITVQSVGGPAHGSTAHAYAGGAIELMNAGGAAHLTGSLANSGKISVGATASITNAAVASVTAHAGSALKQGANNAHNFALTLANSGDISMHAAANGVATSSRAQVRATVASVLGQYASANGVGTADSASLALTNSGALTLAATAAANASWEARASAVAGGLLWQNVDSVSDVVETITNTGSIHAAASAVATARENNAVTAYGVVHDIFRQGVDGNGDGTVSQSISNSGDLIASATAKTTGSWGRAKASLGDVFEQYVDSTIDDGSQSIDNLGDLTATLNANAVSVGGTNTRVSAHVTAHSIFFQKIEHAVDSLDQSLTNSGALSLTLSATAKGAQQHATARATVGSAIKQTGETEGSLAQSITNSGSFGFNLTASAANTGTGYVQAHATLEGFAKQNAEGTASGSSVLSAASDQRITNSGSFSFMAAAAATGHSRVDAGASFETAFKQYARDFESASQTFSNSGTFVFNQTAKAKGGGNHQNLSAVVEAENIFSQEIRDVTDSAVQTASNSGAITADLVASAIATNATASNVKAGVRFGDVFDQYITGADSGSQTLTNSGTVSVAESATATGKHSADAYSDFYFGYQDFNDVSAGEMAIANTASIVSNQTVKATATQFASAKAYANDLGQYANNYSTDGLSTSMSITNSGTLDFTGNVVSKGGVRARARVQADAAAQGVEATDLIETFTNSGSIHLAAVATALPNTLGAGVTATSENPSSAYAVLRGLQINTSGVNGTFSSAHVTSTRHAGGHLTANISNSGSIEISALANADQIPGAYIKADAAAVSMIANVNTYGVSHTGCSGTVCHSSNLYAGIGGNINAAVVNSGTLDVFAGAKNGYADAAGVVAAGGNVNLTFNNKAGAAISASAQGAAAQAFGLLVLNEGNRSRQSVHTRSGAGTHYHTTAAYHSSQVIGAASTVSGKITNSGSIDVTARVSGSGKLVAGVIGEGSTINYYAFLPAVVADGISINAIDNEADVTNAGTINASATGTSAVANGIHLFGKNSVIDRLVTGHYFYDTVHAHWTNQWDTVTHTNTSVPAGTKVAGKVSNSGTITVAVSGQNAKAAGINIDTDSFTGSLANSGSIAATASGKGATATGVLVDADSIGSGTGFTNSGGSISAIANGAWGSAIDVSGAPKTFGLALNGGTITGNIVENAAGNAITVGSGNLVLNGLINPSKSKVGSLTVGTNGTLTLGMTGLGGGGGYVSSYVQNGTLAIPGTTDGSSGSIHAGAATLNGAAIVNLNFAGTHYDTSTTYKVVFSDTALSGTWSSVAPNSGGTFFSADGVYSTNEADITLTRATFDSIAGLTSNQQSVAQAIETIYDAGATGAISDMIAALFTLTPSQFEDVLTALSGVSAAELSAANQAAAQSFLDMINNHLGDTSTEGGTVASLLSGNDTLAANVAPDSVTPAQLSSLSGTRVWGGGFQSGGSVDATKSGPAYTSHQNGLVAGVDVPVSRNVLVGIAGIYSTGDIKTEKMLGFGTYNGVQVAGYGRFVADNGLYALGSVSYGDFTNKLNRYVSVPGFASGNVHGEFDGTTWGLYGEAGWKLDVGEATRATPYVALSYLDADSDGYTETGSFPVPLTVGGSSSKATTSYLGVKLATDWTLDAATITPRLTAAWQHDFTKDAWQMNAAFSAVPTVGFGLTGSDLARDFAYVDGGVTLHTSDVVDILLDYQGRFSSDRSDSTFLMHAKIKF